MSGLMKNYNFTRYMESLENTRMQAPIRKVKIDYKALLKYANEKGVQPCDLEKEEQERFVIHS
ncbi:MAG: hypothetical protein IKO03_16720 [Lachnospiraceae bacterium]|nr:hypothetical protein [Lachnospiraceae bacterium]MBR3510404.1 hypothetical protein [Lachnospiraceae bacterium]MBR4605454.1 hypothetical protein [Lachnospiraceae bacterium]